jgi:uncharacterized membrane protein (DUF4010 family)
MPEASGMALLQAPPLGLAVALGAGLLIGIERERRKGRGDDRQAAGLRSFVVAALTGALAQALPVPGLVVIGAALVALLAASAYWKSRSRDPGLTTELALFATYLIGVQSVLSPALGAACGAGLAALLVARARLHHLATALLSDQELHDGLLLIALALIALPLVPDAPIAALGGIQPRPLAALVLLIMAMQAAGEVALRWLGPQRGLMVSGFLGGFVSSTATVASLGGRARADPARVGVLAGSAVLSAAATWVQGLVITVALSPAAAAALWPTALAAALACAAAGGWMARPHGAAAAEVAAAPAAAEEEAEPAPAADADASPARSALRPREALTVALLLGGVAVAVGLLQQRFGDAGLGLGVALAGLVDAHAPIASLASLHAAGTLDASAVVASVLLAVACNTLTRCGVALVAGGRRYGLRVAVPLAGSLGLAVMMAAWTVGF